MPKSRTEKSLINARINLLFYTLTLGLSFFSRKIFLDYLGADFLGLTSTINGILGFLNLGELGISAVIGVSLYKPVYDNDQAEINNILSVFGFIYNRIGKFIFGIGILISFLLPFIFGKEYDNLLLVYFIYYTFLITTSFGYFFNYRQILLGVDQKNYVVAKYFNTANLLKTILQMTLAYYFSNLWAWVWIELIFSLLYCFILNWKIKQEYPWLKSSVKTGQALFLSYQSIISKVKQYIAHLVGSFVLRQTDSILIYSFVGLKMVAYYGNYTVIVAQISALFNTILSSMNAGIGNLWAEGDKKKIIKVFWELMALRYYVGGILVLSLYYLMAPFITIWLGGEYVLDDRILILLLITIYIEQTRGPVNIFLSSKGQFKDVWAPITEASVNLIISIFCGHYWGIAGVLMGTIASLSIIVVIWKPYLLFSSEFKLSIWLYWKEVFLNFFGIIFVFIVFDRYLNPVILSYINPCSNYYSWGIYALYVCAVVSIFYGTLLLVISEGMKGFFSRIKCILLNKYENRNCS